MLRILTLKQTYIYQWFGVLACPLWLSGLCQHINLWTTKYVLVFLSQNITSEQELISQRNEWSKVILSKVMFISHLQRWFYTKAITENLLAKPSSHFIPSGKKGSPWKLPSFHSSACWTLVMFNIGYVCSNVTKYSRIGKRENDNIKWVLKNIQLQGKDHIPKVVYESIVVIYHFPFSLNTLHSLCFESFLASLGSLPRRAFQTFIFKVVFLKIIIVNPPLFKHLFHWLKSFVLQMPAST